MLATRVHAADTQVTTILVLHETNWREYTGGNADRQCEQDAKAIFGQLAERLPVATMRHLRRLFEQSKPTPDVQTEMDQMFGG